MKSGIYTITNLINGKIYVGSCTSNINQRFNNHKNELRRGKHKNSLLQRSYNKYGSEAFKFEVLEYHEPEYCIAFEQYWINMLDVCNRERGYNLAPTAGNSLGQRRTTEQKLNISKATTGKRVGKLNPRYGTTWSEETRKKIENSSRNKAVLKLDKEGNIIQEYKSLADAGRDNNLHPDHIIKVCKNKPHHLTAGGYKWKYKDEEI